MFKSKVFWVTFAIAMTAIHLSSVPTVETIVQARLASAATAAAATSAAPIVNPRAGISVPAEITLKPSAPGFLSFTLEPGQKLGMQVVGEPEKFLLSRQWTDDPSSYTFLLWGGEPGTYHIVWWIGGETSGKTTRVTVAGPTPVPPPGPKPTPDPVPVVNDPSPMFVVIIEQTDVEAGSRGTLLGSPTLNKYFTEKGHKWRVANVDVRDKDGNPPGDIKTFIESARGKVLPQMWIVDKSLKTRWTGSAPSGANAEKDLIALLKSVGG